MGNKKCRIYAACGVSQTPRYDTEMKGEGVRDILKLGVAFSGKKVCVKIK